MTLMHVPSRCASNGNSLNWIGLVNLNKYALPTINIKFNLRFTEFAHFYSVPFSSYHTNVNYMLDLQLRRPFAGMCIRWYRRPTIFQWQIASFFFLHRIAKQLPALWLPKWSGMCSNLASQMETEGGQLKRAQETFFKSQSAAAPQTHKGMRQTSV